MSSVLVLYAEMIPEAVTAVLHTSPSHMVHLIQLPSLLKRAVPGVLLCLSYRRAMGLPRYTTR